MRVLQTLALPLGYVAAEGSRSDVVPPQGRCIITRKAHTVKLWNAPSEQAHVCGRALRQNVASAACLLAQGSEGLDDAPERRRCLLGNGDQVRAVDKVEHREWI
jgi:hypothetical protein